jgi:hypothetical protein
MLLTEEELGARDLSHILRIREKEVYDHLDHIDRSVASQKKRLVVNPAHCLECSYVFESRSRLGKPGRCPRCKGEHIADPKYRVVEAENKRSET